MGRRDAGRVGATFRLTPAGFKLLIVSVVVAFAAYFAAALILRPPTGVRWMFSPLRRGRRRSVVWGAALLLLGLLSGAVFFGIGAGFLRLIGIQVFGSKRTRARH